MSPSRWWNWDQCLTRLPGLVGCRQRMLRQAVDKNCSKQLIGDAIPYCPRNSCPLPPTTLTKGSAIQTRQQTIQPLSAVNDRLYWSKHSMLQSKTYVCVQKHRLLSSEPTALSITLAWLYHLLWFKAHYYLPGTQRIRFIRGCLVTCVFELELRRGCYSAGRCHLCRWVRYLHRRQNAFPPQLSQRWATK